MNKIATELIKAIEEYKKESSKVDYDFSLEEQMQLQREIDILNKHIELLIDYELKRKDK